MKIKLFFLLPVFLMFFGCVSDNEGVTPEKEILKSVTYEVIFFEFTADTGNNSSRLKYNIKYNNPNNVAIKGSTAVTMDYNGIILKPIKRVPPYIEIEANSSYTENYNVESPHDTHALSPEQIKTFTVKFVSAEFVFAID